MHHKLLTQCFAILHNASFDARYLSDKYHKLGTTIHNSYFNAKVTAWHAPQIADTMLHNASFLARTVVKRTTQLRHNTLQFLLQCQDNGVAYTACSWHNASQCSSMPRNSVECTAHCWQMLRNVSQWVFNNKTLRCCTTLMNTLRKSHCLLRTKIPEWREEFDQRTELTVHAVSYTHLTLPTKRIV